MKARTAAQIALIAIDYEAAFTALNNGLNAVRLDASKLSSRDWIIDMGVVIANIRACGNKMRSVDTDDAKLAESIKAMAKAYDDAMDYLTSGIDARSAARVTLAARKIARGDTHLREVVECLNS